MYASYMSGLSVSAPSSLTFFDADQPVSLYDYLAHNELEGNADLTNATAWPNGNITASDFETLTDANTGAVGFRGQSHTFVAGEKIVFSFRTGQDAVASSTRFSCAVVSFGTGGYCAFYFDTSAAGTNYGFPNDALSVIPDDVSIVDGTTYWDVSLTLTAPVGSDANGAIAYYPAAGEAIADLTTSRADASYRVNNATGTSTFSRSQLRDYSSPSTYVTTTAAVASYGDIQFADAQYNVAVDAYRLTITVGSSGTIDFDNTAYAAVTENAGGDGTGTIDVTGTLAQLNALFLPTSPAIAGFASETSSISGIIRHVASGRLETFNISVTSTATATFLLLSDGTSYLLLSDGTSKLKLSK